MKNCPHDKLAPGQTVPMHKLHFTSKKLYWDIITVHKAFFKLYSHFSTILFATLIRWGEPTRAGFYFNSKPPWTQHSPRGPPAFLTLSLSIYPTPHCSRQHHTKWKIKKIEWKIRQEHKDTFHDIQYWDSTGPKYCTKNVLVVFFSWLSSSTSWCLPCPFPVLYSLLLSSDLIQSSSATTSLVLLPWSPSRPHLMSRSLK